jgi:prepilin-type N-terminal cleavage/methylation domain-containing protein
MSNQIMGPQRSIGGTPRCVASQEGFSLVEVLVAVVVLVTGLIAVAELFIISTNANRAARRVTSTAVLAQQKIEQLRGLTWGFDDFGLPISDYSTNVTVTPPTPAGGAGLQPSPGGTLATATLGYVDYLDAYGAWVGTGTSPPAGAVYERRWSVDPLPLNPNNTLVFQVVVDRIAPASPATDRARQVTLKTRKSI